LLITRTAYNFKVANPEEIYKYIVFTADDMYKRMPKDGKT